MKYFSYLLLFISIGLISSCGNTTTTEAPSYSGPSLESIAAKVFDGNAEEAKKELEYGYLLANPDDATAYVILGNINEGLNENGEARKAFEKALELDPGRAQAMTGLGILSRKEGNLEEAVLYYKKAIAADPEYAQAYSSMLVISVLQSNYPQAIEFGEKAWTFDTSDPVIAANLCLSYHYAGNIEKRDEFLGQAELLGYPNIDRLKELVSTDIELFEATEE